MWKGKQIIILFSLLLGLFLVTVTTQEETEAQKRARCKDLDETRANFTACCEQYPLMVAWTWQMDQCTDSCYMAKTPTRCCVLSCVFYMIGVLKANFNADGSVASTVVDPAGLIYSFMLSVGNDTQWEPIITESVNWCNDQYGGVTSKYECKVIPLNLYEIVDCTTVQDYLKCPPWNPHNLPECQQTQEFVRDCLA